MFQSSPAIAGGRYLRPPILSAPHRSFNPRPPLRAGATVCCLIFPTNVIVSILARPCGRALHHTSCVPPSMRCFNPRPPLRAGATARAYRDGTDSLFQSSPALAGGRYDRLLGTAEQLRVSILARPCGRALHWMPASFILKLCFNPRPPLRAGATHHLRRFPCCSHSFNPRPPLRAGATPMTFLHGYTRFVSILARPCGRALRDVCHRTSSVNDVSILARPCGRALRIRGSTGYGSQVFQSSPALAGGRYLERAKE